METKRLTLDKEIKLAYYSEYINDSNIGVVLLHGLAEHKGRYHDFINQLLKNNISVFALDLRGHGESTGKRGDVKDFNDYLNDLHSFVCYIKDKYPNLKLAIFGHSLSGLIACAYVSTYNTIDLLILSSPLLHAPPIAKLFKFIPYKMLGFIKTKKRHSESKEMLEYSHNDPLACHYYTLRLIGIAFRQGIIYTTKKLKSVTIPVLMMGGKLDNLVRSSNFEYILEQFGSDDKTLKIYDNVRHRIVQNDYKDEIIADIISWINKID